MATWKPDSHDCSAGTTTRIKYRIKVQGNLVSVTKKIANALSPCTAGRGVVTTFTKGARLRMLKTIARIDWGKVPHGVFVTLTYPDSYAERDYSLRSYDRSRFLQELERYMHREVSVLWRTEYQRRKSGKRKGLISPHLHLMCLGVKYVAHDAVRRWWRGILDCRGALATDVRGVSGPEGCGKYLSKYLSKSSSLDNAAYLNKPYMNGRHWGLTRLSLVPWARVERDAEVSEEEYTHALEVWQAMDQDLARQATESFTVLGEMRKADFIRNLQNATGQPPTEPL
jgi:hypothetical protein